MFKKAVVWGVPLHQHTNSYVYAGYHKAFKDMGYDAYWLNSNSDISGMDFADTLFITEGQHDGNIPKRNDCKYVLHNCDFSKYDSIKAENKLCMQVYTTDVHQWETENLKDGAFYMKGSRLLFQPWATDLLPDEINFDDADAPRNNQIHWCGTMGGGRFGNENEINAFKYHAMRGGISWHYHPPGTTSFEENRELVKTSYLAPAIHGTWQAEKCYFACRIFKNISYGQLLVTNNLAADKILNLPGVFNLDMGRLFLDAREKIGDKGMVLEAMKMVKEKHTFINRVKTILSVI